MKNDPIHKIWRHLYRFYIGLTRKNRTIALLYSAFTFGNRYFPMPKELGKCGNNTLIEYPVWFDSRKNVHLDDNVRIRSLCQIINSPKECVYIKKYTSIAANCTLITNNHRSTVGIPQFILGRSHINDKSADITINEDVWIGANVTILPGVIVGRGSIIAAGSVVSKNVPPYAIVAGVPAHVIAKKFNYEDVLIHEKILYPENERMKESELKKIFEENFVNKKVYGIHNTSFTNEQIETLEKLNWNVRFRSNTDDMF